MLPDGEEPAGGVSPTAVARVRLFFLQYPKSTLGSLEQVAVLIFDILGNVKPRRADGVVGNGQGGPVPGSAAKTRVGPVNEPEAARVVDEEIVEVWIVVNPSAAFKARDGGE